MSEERKCELLLPDNLKNDSNAIEQIRIWSSKDKQVFVITNELWHDPAAVGLMLVDLARHAALAYERSSGQKPIDTLNRIKQGFDAEWNFPTDEPESLD